MRTAITQHEWLTEDVEQIRRYFPGATFIETFDTPFDIHTLQQGHTERTAQAAAEPVHSAGVSEKRAGECGLTASGAMLAPEERRVSLQCGVFLLGELL